MASSSIVTPRLTKLISDTATFAMQVFSGKAESSISTAPDDLYPTLESRPCERSPENIGAVDRANALTAEFEKTHDTQSSDQAISILESILDHIPDNDPDQHYLLFNLALTICRRVEIQVSKKSTETLLDLHLALTRSFSTLRRAVNASPASFDVKVQYFGQLGHTATLWSTILSSRWSADDVFALLAQLKAERDARDDRSTYKISGFLSEVLMASTLSTAFGATQNPDYRNQGRKVYRHILKSTREFIPLDVMIDPISSVEDMLGVMKAFAFIKDGAIPFIVQVMALAMQSLIEIPISAVIGRRAAALAIDKGLYKEGVGWLEQCLMLVWGQLDLRAPAPLVAARVQGVNAESEDKMRQIVAAFLGLLLYVDDVADDGVSIPHPEQIAYTLVDQWLKVPKEAYSNLFKPQSFNHIMNAARMAPVVMLNLWGSQCDALVLLGEGQVKRIRLDGVTEEFAADLQAKFREGLQSNHFHSRGDEISDVTRSSVFGSKSSTIHRVLAAIWKKVVKPIFDEMKLEPVENAALDPPRLTWCPTGPTSFFPLHAAGLYDSKERGTKTYEYVASSYTPTLSILADANITLSGEPGPFKGILAVSQPNNHDLVSIPKTVDEVEALIQAVDETVALQKLNGIPQDTIKLQWLNEAEATKQAVLSGMESSTWVHLACHARQYPLNTSESAFMLANGETLSLVDISKHASANGELAFLSACQTAAGDFDLSEEGIHLAAGMLVAGYRSVIATTWSVHDEDAPIVAKEVYNRLLNGGQIHRTGTALALHHATRLLREKVGEGQFLHWAPFIHLGI